MNENVNSSPMNLNPWEDIEAKLRGAADYIEPTEDLRPRLLESAERRILVERSLGSFLCMAVAAMFLATVLTGAANAPEDKQTISQRLVAGSSLPFATLCQLNDRDWIDDWVAARFEEAPDEEAWRGVQMLNYLRVMHSRVLRGNIQ